MKHVWLVGFFSLVLTAAVLLVPTDAEAIAGRAGMHAVHLDPRGDAEDLGQGSWGGGFDVVVAVPGIHQIVAGALGFEVVMFDSKTLVSTGGPFDFRRELDTNQDFVRIFLGTEIGPHGRGFFQPYVGLHGAVVNHSITTTLTQPDDLNPDNTITQKEEQNDWGIGYDATLGANLNMKNRFGVYGGVKYQQSFGLDQPLDFNGTPRAIDPEYWQIFFGVSVDLGFLEKLDEGPDEEREEDQWD